MDFSVLRINKRVLFYLIAFSGGAVFSGWQTSLLAASLLLLMNVMIQPVTSGFLRKFPPSAALVIQSLLSLGLFPWLWLAAVAVFGPSYHGFLGGFVTILSLGAAVLWKGRARAGLGQGENAVSLLAVLALVLLTTYWPMSRMGKYLPPNGYAYRAYFSSDYLKHFSVVEAINKGRLPPANPYFAEEKLHYSWLVYGTPAFLAKIAGSTSRALLAWSFLVNLLFLALLWELLKQIVRRRFISYALLIVPLSISLEGLYFIIRECHFNLNKLWLLGGRANIDALERWVFGLPEINTLLRSLFYTPQHLLGLSFLVIFFFALEVNSERVGWLSAIVAFSLAASFFIGGILLLAWVVHFLVKEFLPGLRTKTDVIHSLKRGAGYFIIPLASLAVFEWLWMTRLKWRSEFELHGLNPGQIASLLFLNLGLVLLLGMAGLALGRFHKKTFHWILFFLTLVIVSLVRIRGFENDLSLKLGLVLIIQCLLLTACLFRRFQPKKIAATGIFLLLVLPGSLTLLLDIRNAGAIRSRQFTLYVSEEEADVLNWIRKETLPGAVVQSFPPARQRYASIIPSLAGRNTLIGDPKHGQIFGIPQEEYAKNLAMLEEGIKRLPASGGELKKMGIDYLFWGEAEAKHFGFYPALRRAYQSGGTVLYALD